jgi:hypothetical protein
METKMSDLTPGTAPDGSLREPAKESKSQAWVAFAIIVSMTMIGLASLWVGYINKTEGAFTLVGAIVGVLGNALQAPSGISSVISSAMSKKSGVPQ